MDKTHGTMKPVGPLRCDHLDVVVNFLERMVRGWAERLGVQLQIPVRARRAACMAGRIRRDGCRRSRASVSSPCPAGAGAPVGACQPA